MHSKLSGAVQASNSTHASYSNMQVHSQLLYYHMLWAGLTSKYLAGERTMVLGKDEKKLNG